jgi:lipoprotein-releasing system ATP-binding protein
MSDALRLEGVARSFREGSAKVEVLRGVSCTVAAGEIVALLGPSGSGKSTLLQIAGLLDRPTDGEVWIEGAACGRLSDSERTATRRHRLGFVYQFHHLLPEFSALENVAMPRRIAGANKWDAADHARALLHRLGLGERLDHRPGELSGGERQRVAVARAIANGPGVLLADEPTGNLDHRTAEDLFHALLNLVREARVGALIATHNTELARHMDRRLRLQDGALTEE